MAIVEVLLGTENIGENFIDQKFQLGLCYILRCNFLKQKFCVLIDISLQIIPKGPIDNNPSLV